jgi:Ergosterol biosynthesis ERG4/ERG24 family
MHSKKNVKILESDGSIHKDWSGGAGILPGRETLGPLFLMAVTPVFAMVICRVFQQHHGNARQFAETVWNEYTQQNVTLTQQVRQLWPDPFDLSTTWPMIGCFLVGELLLMRFIPGKQFIGNVTPNGHRPVYKANGMACYLITLISLMALDYYESVSPTTGFRMSLIYDKFGNILSTMNVLALVFCIFLLIKGYVAPSGKDSGTTGSLINDFYWGMELYPRVAGWDVKQFTNCRAGMMFWAVAIVSFCYKNMELNHGELQYGLAVSVALQLVYISKFFHWEMGYMCRCVASRPFCSVDSVHVRNVCLALPCLACLALLARYLLPHAVQHGHSARSRRILYLLGLSRLGSSRLYERRLLSRGKWAETGRCHGDGYSIGGMALRLDQL